MRWDATAALRLTLRGHLSLRKSRLESFCVLVVGVLLSRTVNLGHLACLFPTRAEIASNDRRLQRFFEQVILEPGRKESQQFQNVVRDIFGLEASELASLGAKRFHGKPPLIGLSPSTQRRGKSANLCYHSISFRPGS
jgi:hypothetical protein